MYSRGQKELLKVKVKLILAEDQSSLCKRFTLDPQVLSFELLQSTLAKSFQLQSELSVSYLMRDRNGRVSQVPIFNDWDLDAAIERRSSEPFLKLIVRPIRYETEILSEWDVVTPFDIPPDKEMTKNNTSFISAFVRKLASFKYKFSGKATTYDTEKSSMCFSEYQHFLDSNGRLVSPQGLRESVYRGGVTPSLRKIVWRHLLDVFPAGLTSQDREIYLKRKAQEYYKLRDAWKQDIVHGRMTEAMKFVTGMVKKDVIRTDRSHPFYKGKEDNKNIMSLFNLLCTYSLNHPEVLYCQGMCDVASPLLVVQENEAHAYLCFCALMQRLKYNFLCDGKAMSCKFEHLIHLLKLHDPEFYAYLAEKDLADLIFAYRWLLLELKREFPFNDVLTFLEVMWSTLPPKQTKADLPLTSAAVNNIEAKSAKCCSSYTMMIDRRPKSADATMEPASVLETSDSSEYSTIDCTSYTSTARYMINTALDIEQHLTTISNESAGRCRSSSLTSQHSATDLGRSHSMNCVSAPDLGMCISQSKFYIALEYSSRGSPYYVYNDSAELPSDSEPKRGSGSISSVDSGIRSRAPSPTKSSCKNNADDPLFDFETSSAYHTHKLSVLPPPNEFGYGNPFLMYASLTLLLLQRDRIMDKESDFSEVMVMYSNSARKNNVHKILHSTKLLYQEYVRSQQLWCDCDSDFDFAGFC